MLKIAKKKYIKHIQKVYPKGLKNYLGMREGQNFEAAVFNFLCFYNMAPDLFDMKHRGGPDFFVTLESESFEFYVEATTLEKFAVYNHLGRKISPKSKKYERIEEILHTNQY